MMTHPTYIYIINSDEYEKDLCALEMKSIFEERCDRGVIFSQRKVEPSISAFIRKRLEIISASDDYLQFIAGIKEKQIAAEGFKIEYDVLQGDETEYKDRLEKIREIGYCMEGTPDYYHPSSYYSLCRFDDCWYFAFTVKNSMDWLKHRQKPRSYSISISINIAKALVNIAAGGNRDVKLLDACCGVGTIMLEACFAGYQIEGCDINHKICHDARENLTYYNYSANVICSDIQDMTQNYNAAIVDLPYNLFTTVDDDTILHIIRSAAERAQKLIIVSASDISGFISMAELQISDHCSVKKRGKTSFSREIWVCGRNF